MITIRIFNDRIVCPRCDGNGFLYRMNISRLENSLIVCDECEATWDNWDKIWNEHEDLSSYLEKCNIPYESAFDLIQDYSWFNDPNLKIEELYYKCPLLDILIWTGDCYDINLVRNNFINEQALMSLEIDLGNKIDKCKANIICEDCKHGF